MNKRKIFKERVVKMLDESNEIVKSKIDNAISSGAIDLDRWEPQNAGMILPKALVVALLQSEIPQYDCSGTGYEKTVKKEARNLRCFI